MHSKGESADRQIGRGNNLIEAGLRCVLRHLHIDNCNSAARCHRLAKSEGNQRKKQTF